MSEKPTYEELEQRVQELKQAESERNQALQASTEELRLVIDTSPVGIYTVDPLGNFVTTNLAYEQMLGYSKGELGRLSFFDVTYPENRPKNKELFQEIFFFKTTNFSMEKRYIRKDGAMIEVAVHATGVMDAEGNTIFGTAFVEDITERRQAEDALIEREKEYGETLEDLIVGVVVHSSDTTILLSNRAASNILGLTQGQISGKKTIDPAWNFVHEDSSIMKIEDYPVSKVFSTKKPIQDYVVGIIRPDKEYITWVIVNAIPIFSNNNELKKVVVNFVDITERKQAEKGREKLLKALHEALETVKTLNGLLPICGHCKKIRDDKGYWSQIEGYIEKYSYAKFSHGICPECIDELYGKESWYIKMKKKREQKE